MMTSAAMGSSFSSSLRSNEQVRVVSGDFHVRICGLDTDLHRAGLGVADAIAAEILSDEDTGRDDAVVVELKSPDAGRPSISATELPIAPQPRTAMCFPRQNSQATSRRDARRSRVDPPAHGTIRLSLARPMRRIR